MRRASCATVAGLLLSSFILAAPGGAAEHQGSCHPGFLWQDEEISLWFHGKKAFVQVYDHNASDPDESVAYGYHGGEIVERDPVTNRTLAKMSLGRAYPHSSSCVVTQEGDFTNLTIAVTDDVKAVGGANKMVAKTGGGSPGKGGVGTSSALGQATATFLYHFNRSSNEAKFDLHVEGWPWLGANELAYSFDIVVDGGTVMTAENGVGILNASGAQVGYVEWAPTANATYADGHNETADVESNATGGGSSAAHVTLGFADVTPGYAKLEYDPIVGVGLWAIVGNRLIAVPLPLGVARGALGELLRS